MALSAPPLIVPKDPPLPGPGQYDIGDYNGLSKHPVPTAAFASRTERIPKKSQADMRPGPGKALKKLIHYIKHTGCGIYPKSRGKGFSLD